MKNIYKWTYILLLTLASTAAMAQVNKTKKISPVNRAVTRAVVQASSAQNPKVLQQVEPAMDKQERLSTRELIEAETELALIRNARDSKATFETYPYLLDPQYRRTTDESLRQQIRQAYQTKQRQNAVPATVKITVQASSTNTSHNNTHSTWARKVGL